MTILALITWIGAAALGIYLLAIWLIEYDTDFQGTAATRLPVPVISSHAVLALAGLVVWLAYIVLDQDRLAWVSLAILGVVVVLGLTMAVRWVGVYRAYRLTGRTRVLGGRNPPRTGPAVPPERHFPVPVIVVHGLFAFTTVTLVLLTAFGVGGS
jgi:hypothetical protein